MSLQEGCHDLLKADCVTLTHRLTRGQKAGIRMTHASRCATCGNAIMPGKQTTGCVVFFCNHVFHQRCLKQGLEAIREANAAAKRTATSSMSSSQLEQVPPSPGGQDGKLRCTICYQAESQAKARGARARPAGK